MLIEISMIFLMLWSLSSEIIGNIRQIQHHSVLFIGYIPTTNTKFPPKNIHVNGKDNSFGYTFETGLCNISSTFIAAAAARRLWRR